jgi:transglutaminase-like putative cysteine protease
MSAVMTDSLQPDEQERQPLSLRILRALGKTLAPEDGWMTILLLVAVVYITILSIQSANPPWVPGKMYVLTYFVFMGMLLGYLVVQLRQLPEGLLHPLAIAFGVVFAYQQTSLAEFPQNGPDALFTSLRIWFTHAILSGESNADPAVFLFLLALLTFLLAYISFWLALRARRPWLAILANCTVLLINIGWAGEDMLLFLVFFLLLALLLLVRFNYAEHLRTWRARRLRYSPDLGWDFMQTGAVFAVVVLLLAYLLPAGAANAQALGYLNDPQGAWQQLQDRFVRVFGGANGAKGSGGFSAYSGLFSDNLRLVGTVKLQDRPLLHYVPGTPTDGSEYLIAQTYDKYDGTAQWSSTDGDQNNFGANTSIPSSGSVTRTVTYTITYDAIGGSDQRMLLAPGAEAASFNVPSVVTVSELGKVTTIWRAAGARPNGQSYLAKGYVTDGSVQQLRAVPWPRDAKGTGQLQFTQNMIDQYVQFNSPVIRPEVSQAAREAAKGANNMYDAATALEEYLRTFKYSMQNSDPPPDQDATVWFLRNQVGFCTFFASAMTLMARSLGMPARVATGFTAGVYDSKTGTYIVKETASHAWTQIYFAKYGWIDFEPTQTFSQIGRISTGLGATPSASPTRGPGDAAPTATAREKDVTGTDVARTGGNSPLSNWLLYAAILLLGLLVAMIVFLLWWRSLGRGMRPAASALLHVAWLGKWAGAPPRPHETPLEYAGQLSQLIPGERESLRKIGMAYNYERWDSQIPSGIANDLPALYHRVRVALTQSALDRVRSVRIKLPRRRRA